jgi:hypothetical protein
MGVKTGKANWGVRIGDANWGKVCSNNRAKLMKVRTIYPLAISVPTVVS